MRAVEINSTLVAAGSALPNKPEAISISFFFTVFTLFPFGLAVEALKGARHDDTVCSTNRGSGGMATPMIDIVFDVSPPGIYGMNRLASFLNAMKERAEIADWHPMRAITESKGSRYVVQFVDDRDAARASAQWTSENQAIRL